VPTGFLIVFGGNVGISQSFETILDAADLLKSYEEIHWVILGDGRRFSWVEHEVRKRGLDKAVHLLGRVPAEVMPRYYALAEVLLVTLRKEPIFSLTIPSKVQSYLACGKPIVAALDGEGARIVQDAKAGLTPAPEDAGALAEAILAMYRMPPDERRLMGLRGRTYFETHFDRALLLDRLDKWIKEMRNKGVTCAS
jgi:glycosyltransferase involved in cell wall biosynthesis